MTRITPVSRLYTVRRDATNVKHRLQRFHIVIFISLFISLFGATVCVVILIARFGVTSHVGALADALQRGSDFSRLSMRDYFDFRNSELYIIQNSEKQGYLIHGFVDSTITEANTFGRNYIDDVNYFANIRMNIKVFDSKIINYHDQRTDQRTDCDLSAMHMKTEKKALFITLTDHVSGRCESRKDPQLDGLYIETKSLFFDREKMIASGDNGVRISSKSGVLTAAKYRINYNGGLANFMGGTRLERRNPEGIDYINSAVMDIEFNGQEVKNIAFSGNVHAVQWGEAGASALLCDRAMLYPKTGDIELIGSVRLKTDKGNVSADNGLYNQKTGLLQLKSNVDIRGYNADKSGVIKSDFFTYNILKNEGFFAVNPATNSASNSITTQRASKKTSDSKIEIEVDI